MGSVGTDVLFGLVGEGNVFMVDRFVRNHGGRYENFAWPGIHVQHPGDYMHSVSFGAIGIGVATAMGAAISGAGKPTLVLAGDGGFELGGFSELLTAAHRVDLPAIADFLHNRDPGGPRLIDVKLDPEQMRS